MTGWLTFLGFCALVLSGLWRLGRFDRRLQCLGAVALLCAGAGYAWQGQPGLAGAPSKIAEERLNDTIPDDLRKTFASSMNSEGQWLALADALLRAGKSRAAVSILSEGSKRAPFNPDIWVGLGNALVVHGGGQMNPAAQFAFEQAARLSPDHPGPPFFLGLGLAQEGKLDQAREIWSALLARAPKDAPWRAELESRLKLISQPPGDPQLPSEQKAN